MLTLAVTLTGVDRAQPWRDELASWSAATRSLGDLARMVGTIDAATGPWYLLLHGWLALAGDSVTALRLPSALAVSGAAGLTTVLGQRLLGAPAGLLAGLLFAVLPGTSRYGQEARPYALAAFLAVLATLLLVDALGRDGWTRWAGYAATVVALGLTHLVALTLLAAHAVIVLAPQRGRAGVTDPVPVARYRRWPPGPRRRPGRWALALVPAALVLVPLVELARRQRSRQLDWVDLARPTDLTGLPGGLAQSAAVGGLLLGLAALGAIRYGHRALPPTACLALPVLVLFAVALAVPIWVPRYLFFTVPFGCLLAGAALTLTPPARPARPRRAGAGRATVPAGLAVVAVAGLLGLPDQVALRRTHEWPRVATVDYRGAARVVAAGRRPGDAVVYSPRDGWLFLDLGLAYHLGPDRPRDVLAVRDQAGRGDLWADECPRPAECLAGVERVWLVVAGRRADPLAAVGGTKGDALRTGFTVTRVWPRPGLTVALLTR
ncbi:glycosyltransferase family 39 protein [Micromonospora fluostatini]|uniref:glycosyltransferase family 39 protein n=1 Tax=Micromonospora sp. JCM 30529 TaxID=3421643 RepID=UPI003D164DAA